MTKVAVLTLLAAALLGAACAYYPTGIPVEGQGADASTESPPAMPAVASSTPLVASAPRPPSPASAPRPAGCPVATWRARTWTTSRAIPTWANPDMASDARTGTIPAGTTVTACIRPDGWAAATAWGWIRAGDAQ